MKAYAVVSLPDRLAVLYSRIDSDKLFVAYHLHDVTSTESVAIQASELLKPQDFDGLHCSPVSKDGLVDCTLLGETILEIRLTIEDGKVVGLSGLGSAAVYRNFRSTRVMRPAVAASGSLASTGLLLLDGSSMSRVSD